MLGVSQGHGGLESWIFCTGHKKPGAQGVWEMSVGGVGEASTGGADGKSGRGIMPLAASGLSGHLPLVGSRFPSRGGREHRALGASGVIFLWRWCLGIQEENGPLAPSQSWPSLKIRCDAANEKAQQAWLGMT